VCSDPAIGEQVKQFVNSPILDMGEVGQFLAKNPKRAEELDVHGGKISSARVGRWRQEPEPVRSEAESMAELMKDYCDFWDYEG
jgi:hypothetical protein